MLLPGRSSSWRTAKPQPAPARAQAVPKPETAAQLARRERSRIRLRQKRLASKMWATIRIASRLLAWRRRVQHLRLEATELVRKCANALDTCVREDANRTSNRNAARLLPAYVLNAGCLSWSAGC